MGEACQKMIKSDEIDFMRFILPLGRIPSEHWSDLSKRQYGLLDKWSRKGFWDYGVSSRGGWLTENGKDKFNAVINTQSAKTVEK